MHITQYAYSQVYTGSLVHTSVIHYIYIYIRYACYYSRISSRVASFMFLCSGTGISLFFNSDVST